MGRGGRGRIGEGGLERGEGQCIARKGIMAHRRCQERLTDRKLNVIRRMGEEEEEERSKTMDETEEN